MQTVYQSIAVKRQMSQKEYCVYWLIFVTVTRGQDLRVVTKTGLAWLGNTPLGLDA